MIIDDGGVEIYNSSFCRLKEKGIFKANSLLESRIDLGCVLEIGPGPGHIGLDWLKKTEGTMLKGLDISEKMAVQATENARDLDLSSRAEYLVGDASDIPFVDRYFDEVFYQRYAAGYESYPEMVYHLSPAQ
jgi:predicted O-methyltransferase YrrM